MTTTQAAQRLNVTTVRVQQLINEGRIKATDVGLGTKIPRWSISEEDLTAFMQTRNRLITEVQQAKELHKEIMAGRNEDEDKALLLEAHLTFIELRQPSQEP